LVFLFLSSFLVILLIIYLYLYLLFGPLFLHLS